VIYSHAQTINLYPVGARFRHLLVAFLFTLLPLFSIYAQQNLSINQQENTITIDEIQDAEVYAFGKNVIVKKAAKGVFAFGGNIIVEGKVEEDVATIGGSIIQKQGAFIGGDVVVIGGTYKYEDKQPLRNADKETIMFASYEEELRSLSQDPTQIFTPSFSWSFLVQRLLSVLFWFIVSLALTTIAPGAVSRSVARFHLSTLKVIAIGFLGFLTTTLGVIAGLKFLPNFLSAIIGLMAFVLLILSYVFGRVTLQVSFGKWLQKRFLSENKHSESLALLIGAFVWTLFLSLPYIWTLALLLLFVASLGIILTARSTNNWQKI
jgi:hypothetical protein